MGFLPFTLEKSKTTPQDVIFPWVSQKVNAKDTLVYFEHTDFPLLRYADCSISHDISVGRIDPVGDTVHKPVSRVRLKLWLAIYNAALNVFPHISR